MNAIPGLGGAKQMRCILSLFKCKLVSYSPLLLNHIRCRNGFGVRFANSFFWGVLRKCFDRSEGVVPERRIIFLRALEGGRVRSVRARVRTSPPASQEKQKVSLCFGGRLGLPSGVRSRLCSGRLKSGHPV